MKLFYRVVYWWVDIERGFVSFGILVFWEFCFFVVCGRYC